MENLGGFLGNMQTTVVGKVVCITKYDIDADNKGGAIWVEKANTGRNPNIIGNELIKIRCPFELFGQQHDKLKAGDIQLPGVFEVLADIDMGGQNKAVLTALSIKPYKPDLPTADELAAKPNASGATGSASTSTAAGASGATAQQPNK